VSRVNAVFSTPVDKAVDAVWTQLHTLWTGPCVPVHSAVGDTPDPLARQRAEQRRWLLTTCGRKKVGADVAADASPTAPDPVAALRRIAFLLERTLSDSYRIKAYRGAAAALLKVGAVEVRDRWRAGTLRELPGVGAKTESVVADCLAGRLPPYLEELERTAGPLAEHGRGVRTALRGDLHTHSDWSDGGSPIEEMAMTAMEVGHEYLVLSDHSPRLTVANGLTAERLAQQLEVVDAVNAHLDGSLRLLKGIEVDILDDGTLDQSPEMLDRLEVVVASVHSKLRMDRAAMTRRMVAAVSHPQTNVLGHVTGRLVKGGRGVRPQSEFDATAVFGACRDNGVAVEINSRPERVDPPDDLIAVAVELGCLFAVDSDAHAPGQLDFLDHGAARVEELDLPLDRVVNTWPLDRLLAWANG
jgi:putative hydrolase